MASKPWSVLDQNREALAAPGITAAMPMMAMSDGAGEDLGAGGTAVARAHA